MIEIIRYLRVHKREGQRWRVNAVQQLIEFYEMVSLNDAALGGKEKVAMLKARLALQMFERAMQSLKSDDTVATSPPEASFRMAA
jgi:hypothetical protein